MDALALDPASAYLACVAAAFALLAVAELAVPFRRPVDSRGHRWFTNLSLFAIDTLAVRLVVPFALVGMAAWTEARGVGLFNLIDVPLWLACLLTIVALDLALWVQHWATHRIPLLWRLHRVHHVDRDFDITTGARFHPFEILASMAWKLGVVAALGAPVLGVFLFEVIFAVATLFTHSNVALPRGLEGPVRAVIVTPDMHRIHHSARMAETNSNYSTFLSLWDRLFGTYVAEARAGRRGITIGLEAWQDAHPRRLGWSLWLPFLPLARDGETPTTDKQKAAP